jgi:hypothetical protein
MMSGASSPPASTAQVAAAERLAKSIVIGIEFCAQAGMPLSQLQMIQICRGALLEFDGFQAETRALFGVEQILHRLHSNGSNAS